MHVIEGPTRTKEISKHFSIKGMGKETADEATKEWRSRHTLTNEMIFD
jgi:hypothetical protein